MCLQSRTKSFLRVRACLRSVLCLLSRTESSPTDPDPSHWFVPSIKNRVSVAFVLEQNLDFCLEKCRNENVWGEKALNPCRPFIVSASGRWAYNIRHTFFNWAFSRRAHHLAEPWPRVKQSSLLSNVLEGSHLKCVSNCKIWTRGWREPSNLYHLGRTCTFCKFKLHPRKTWDIPAQWKVQSEFVEH